MRSKRDFIYLSLDFFAHFILPVLIGIVVCVATCIFDLIIHQASLIWKTNLIASSLNLPLPLIRFALPLLIAPFIIILLRHCLNERQINQADITEAIHFQNSTLQIRSAIASIFAAMLSLSGGYSVGQYGPTVVQGSLFGYLFGKSKIFNPFLYNHICIGAGVAAAIAAIFHAPIAAVVFVHEVLLRVFSLRAFAPITIAAVSSYAISSEVFHRNTFLSSTPSIITTPSSYFIVASVAVPAGILGALFIKSTLAINNYVRQRKFSLRQRIYLAAIMSATLSAFLPYIMSSSTHILHSIVNQYDIALSIILLILIAKFFATTFCIGLGVPGGVFNPAIVLGALLGTLINGLLPQSIIANGLLTITTMAAMASAVMGAPIAMILVCLEITNNFSLTGAVMLAVVTANLTAYRAIGATSFFDAQLKSRGINMETGRDLIYLQQRRISHLLSNDFIKLPNNISLEEAEKQLLQQRKHKAHVIDEKQYYLGTVNLIDIRHAIREQKNPEITISAFVDEKIIRLYRLSSLWEAVEMMKKFNGTQIPVVDSPQNPKLLGVLYESTLINEYLNDIQTLRQRDGED